MLQQDGLTVTIERPGSRAWNVTIFVAARIAGVLTWDFVKKLPRLTRSAAADFDQMFLKTRLPRKKRRYPLQQLELGVLSPIEVV